MPKKSKKSKTPKKGKARKPTENALAVVSANTAVPAGDLNVPEIAMLVPQLEKFLDLQAVHVEILYRQNAFLKGLLLQHIEMLANPTDPRAQQFFAQLNAVKRALQVLPLPQFPPVSAGNNPVLALSNGSNKESLEPVDRRETRAAKKARLEAEQTIKELREKTTQLTSLQGVPQTQQVVVLAQQLAVINKTFSVEPPKNNSETKTTRKKRLQVEKQLNELMANSQPTAPEVTLQSPPAKRPRDTEPDQTNQLDQGVVEEERNRAFLHNERASSEVTLRPSPPRRQPEAEKEKEPINYAVEQGHELTEFQRMENLEKNAEELRQQPTAELDEPPTPEGKQNDLSLSEIVAAQQEEVPRSRPETRARKQMRLEEKTAAVKAAVLTLTEEQRAERQQVQQEESLVLARKLIIKEELAPFEPQQELDIEQVYEFPHVMTPPSTEKSTSESKKKPRKGRVSKKGKKKN